MAAHTLEPSVFSLKYFKDSKHFKHDLHSPQCQESFKSPVHTENQILYATVGDAMISLGETKYRSIDSPLDFCHL